MRAKLAKHVFIIWWQYNIIFTGRLNYRQGRAELDAVLGGAMPGGKSKSCVQVRASLTWSMIYEVPREQSSFKASARHHAKSDVACAARAIIQVFEPCICESTRLKRLRLPELLLGRFRNQSLMKHGVKPTIWGGGRAESTHNSPALFKYFARARVYTHIRLGWEVYDSCWPR